MSLLNIDWYISNFDNLSFDEYSRGLEWCYQTIKVNLNPESLTECLQKRVIIHEEQEQLLHELEVYQGIEPNLNVEEKQLFTLYGFYAEKRDFFLLTGRFIVPIRSATGVLISMVGWYADLKKYVTIPTRYFRKDVDWFNIDDAMQLSLEGYNGLVIVVEGIFDALSLRACGLPVIATMGATVEAVKGQCLNLFSKVIMFADADDAGARAVQRWTVPDNTTKILMRLRVEIDIEEEVLEQVLDPLTQTYSTQNVKKLVTRKIKLKDPDDLVRYYGVQNVREILLTIAQSNARIEYIKG